MAATVIGVLLLASALSDGSPHPTAPADSGEAVSGQSSTDPQPAEAVTGEPEVAEPSNDVAPPQAAPPTRTGIGQPAADGDFSFVVNGVDCGRTQLGDQYLNTKAQGVFCIVDLAVTNIGDGPQSFSGENCSLFNAEGQKFSADSEAAIYLEDAEWLYEEINPGNSLATKVIFDVPAGMTPVSIELHDSVFSGGVIVNLV
ncbi:DUF4352 domain-containing protein [Geodermatophilus pulveris]|uniref:DUF4352 domain-containing protein n=1 Tax=Geodermatophilus pulveris TaxID=1564159 RepID=UPI0015C67AF0|nr:DUF4352 domain-containing protein [Geodermatophilus pulveris]